jgi:hypothetical protein
VVAKHGDSGASGEFARSNRFDVGAGTSGRIEFTADPQLRTVFLNPQYLKLAIDRSDVRIREGERITRAVVSTIEERLRALGVQLVVVVTPSKALVYSRTALGAGTGMAADLLQVAALEKQANNDLMLFLKQRGIWCADATEPLRGCLDRRIPVFDSSDADLPSPSGYEAVAEPLARLISAGMASRTGTP